MGFLEPWNGSLDFAHSLKVRTFHNNHIHYPELQPKNLPSFQNWGMGKDSWGFVSTSMCTCAPEVWGDRAWGRTDSKACQNILHYYITLNNGMFFPPFYMYLLLRFASSLLIFLTWVILLGTGCHAGNSLVFSFSRNARDGCAGHHLPTPCIFSTLSHRLLAPVI